MPQATSPDPELTPPKAPLEAMPAVERATGIMMALEAAWLEFEAQVRRFEEVKARVRATRDQIRNGRSEREILHGSAFARLKARTDSMPVIEQAKGILMARHRCGPDEAFDLLRRASQHANIKLSELAARIVEQAASPGSNGSAK